MPLLWVIHNIVVFGKIQYISVGWFTFLPGDIRYRIERTVSYFGCAAILPVFWVWLMAARKRVKELLACLLPGVAWGILLIIVLKKPVWFGLSYALFAASGLWLLAKMALFFRGNKTGTYRAGEPGLIAAYAVLNMLVLFILPSASMRYILPLAPLALVVLGEETSRLSKRHQSIFLTASLCTGALLSLLLAVGDYLLCDADRRLPGILISKGYDPAHTWYFGRMSFDYYLFRARFRNLGADHGSPSVGDFLIDEKMLEDYRPLDMVGNRFSPEPVDTIPLYRWPVRTMGCGAGFYGTDRLPFSVSPGMPQKLFVVYRLRAAPTGTR